MTKIKILIVDDEPRAHYILRNYIGKIANLELAGSCMNAVEAANFMANHDVDLILLDITMPEINGFKFLQNLQSPPLVVFTTAHSEFAMESYEYQPVDYLKKPIPFERFAKAIERARFWMEKGIAKNLPKESIEFKVKGKLIMIPLQDIHYFQSMGNYIKIFVPGKVYISKLTTHQLEKIVAGSSFLRIHKSFIVNKSKITRTGDEDVFLENIKLPIGKTFKKYVKEFI